eukprot:scaffold41674_cov56-Attheya_sp.AAC.1
MVGPESRNTNRGSPLGMKICKNAALAISAESSTRMGPPDINPDTSHMLQTIFECPCRLGTQPELQTSK